MRVNANWIFDILDDLQKFCRLNGIDGAAERLEETKSDLVKEIKTDPIDFRSNSRQMR